MHGNVVFARHLFQLMLIIANIVHTRRVYVVCVGKRYSIQKCTK